MANDAPTILCIASFFKGDRFMVEAAQRGAKVYLLTLAKLLRSPWPRGSLQDVFALHDAPKREDWIHTVSYLARSVPFERIVALDDFDVETAAMLREHLRMPGMGDSTARNFRDKLAMRTTARAAGIPVPDFTGLFHDDAVARFCDRVPPPWMHKPRSEASAAGITKVQSQNQLWDILRGQGDKRSHYLLERFLPGEVFHVDSIVNDGKILFAAAHQCGTPPFAVAHGGGIYTSFTLPEGSPEEKELLALNERLIPTLGLKSGSVHAEFIRASAGGEINFLEAGARVGGVHIAELVECTRGVNPWAAWAELEVANLKGEPFAVPAKPRKHGALINTLAKAESTDYSKFGFEGLAYEVQEKYHAGVVVTADTHEEMCARRDAVVRKFATEITAVMPALPSANH
jgi:biotin carboxylase